MRKEGLLLCLFLMLNCYSLTVALGLGAPEEASDEPEILNIIFFIGDGMGISQVTAANIKINGASGMLSMQSMPVSGLMTTHSVDNLITDSAAGATAMATGFKTRNGMIGVTADTTGVLTILEAARDRNMATGLIATSSITHATPACFAAHVASRNDHQTIAKHLIQSRVDVLLGGGKRYFISEYLSGSSRSDNLDLVKMAKNMNYIFVENRDQFMTVDSGRVLGLFAYGPLSGEPSEPNLPELTERAIKILSKNKNGFFLMVEGSQIDWAGHDNNFERMVNQLQEFDQAIKTGLDFVDVNRNTLVVVTADHETGGLEIISGTPDGREMEVKWAIKKHTGEMVPIFAGGPQAIRFTGVLDNTEIPVIFAELLGIDNFPAKLPELRTDTGDEK